MDEKFLLIQDSHTLDPFFFSVVSGTDHWMFLSSAGDITAGRGNPDHALFPYRTEDKIIDGSSAAGSLSVISGNRRGSRWVWEPFSVRTEGGFDIRRNLYKSVWGEIAVFEEINQSLDLSFQVTWMTSESYGIVRKAEISNRGANPVQLDILDGIRNILPAGVTAKTQNEYSCLLDAYKENRRLGGTDIGVYRLSSRLTDKAEPSESLKATAVWTTLTGADATLLSENKVNSFRAGNPVESESAVRGRRGAYFSVHRRNLKPGESASWYLAANLDRTQKQLMELADEVSRPDALREALEADIRRGTGELRRYAGLSDGFQAAAEENVTVHHYANTLFNIMRGGVFPYGYRIDGEDFRNFVRIRNTGIATMFEKELIGLPPEIDLLSLRDRIIDLGDVNLRRLCMEYLPLSFSRRHGDPSRPWNRFEIKVRDNRGRVKMDYQGNWRDIFQNWEALVLSFPGYLPHILSVFLNAVTQDGYNPYRVTRDGIEWEVPEPDNPWSNIGYWGDHQVIYLQRLLEWLHKFEPDALAETMDEKRFSHADVPYRIRPYAEIRQNPRNTIVFDVEKDRRIAERRAIEGGDGRLARGAAGEILHATLIEKLLIILLAKMSNYVPGGGIWMNTQRPEWNDANNALAGPGLSVVTLCYLRRMAVFLVDRLREAGRRSYSVNAVLDEHFAEIRAALAEGADDDPGDPVKRSMLMDRLGASAERYREKVYLGRTDEARVTRNARDIEDFLERVVRCADSALAMNRRPDGLFHSYNLLLFKDEAVRIRHLQVMLEGQVAVLSSGFLDPQGSLDLLEALRQSPLYREDQHSYMLYPNRELPDFLAINRIPPNRAENIPLLRSLDEAGDASITERDPSGTHRFNGDFANAADLVGRLDELSADPRWRQLAADCRQEVLDLYEEVFDHGSFTGRSGTFFGYEGLGSIYWHMVSKLLLAVQEVALSALDGDSPEAEALVRRYYQIRSGLSFNKTHESYGAFPTDPYSHTPLGGGARQPGMTGQVKEELITRRGELGLEIRGGRIRFNPRMLRREEYAASAIRFEFVDAPGQWSGMEVPAGSLAFTCCGVPIRLDSRESDGLRVVYSDGTHREARERILTAAESRSIFMRAGTIREIHVASG